MSCNWRIHCEDCNNGEAWGHNHGEQTLLQIIITRRILMDLPIDIDFDGSWSAAAYFVRKHAIHRLIIISEYGQKIEPEPEYNI